MAAVAAESKQPAPAAEVHDWTVFDDDACLGVAAPSLASLELMHFPEGVEAVEEIKYEDFKATVVCFWSKIHKGNYPTICTWSDYAADDKYASSVRFVGIARDTDKAQVAKYIKRIGTDAPTLGENGIVIAGGIPLAYDPAAQVNTGFKTKAKLKTLGVDNAFIVDAAGVIQWRCVFNRGKEPSGEFCNQLDRIVKGEEIEKKNPRPVEESDSEDDGSDAGEGNAAGIAMMAMSDY